VVSLGTIGNSDRLMLSGDHDDYPPVPPATCRYPWHPGVYWGSGGRAACVGLISQFFRRRASGWYEVKFLSWVTSPGNRLLPLFLLNVGGDGLGTPARSEYRPLE